MLLSEHGLGSLWSVSSTSLNPCHEEIGLFWKHMKLPPRSWVSVRVQITMSLHFNVFFFFFLKWIRKVPCIRLQPVAQMSALLPCPNDI